MSEHDHEHELAVIERPRHTLTIPTLVGFIILAVAIAGVLFASALRASQHESSVTNRRAFNVFTAQISTLQAQVAQQTETANCRSLYAAHRDTATANEAAAFGQIVIDLAHQLPTDDSVRRLADTVTALVTAATELEHYAANPVTPCPIKE